MDKLRLISLMDGTGMGGSIVIFRTNAPANELKELESTSNEIYNSGSDDMPIWWKVLTNKGYVFEYIDEHSNITPYGTSKDWLETTYCDVKEHYVIG